MGFFSGIGAGLKKTRESLSRRFEDVLSGFKKVDEELFEELEEALIASDVGAASAAAICEELRRQVKRDNITDPNATRALLTDIVAGMLEGGEGMKLVTKPSVILVIGVNGAGKTTTIGKMAARYKAEGKKVVIAAADTFRAAAIEQLQVWADRAGVPMIKREQGSDPASVVFDGITAAKAQHADLLICDTAGRLHTKINLMEELAKIGRIVKRELPDADIETLLVLDAVTGQNAVMQARQFGEACDISGIVLTKLDGTAKGGIVISIRKELGMPVKFIGLGEAIADLEPFDAKSFAKAMFEV